MHAVAKTTTSVPGLRERKKQATRRAIAEAAVRLAAEHGVENVTVEAISEAAGVSPRTFFNYFPSHDDAFVLVDDEVGERIRESVRLAPADRPPLDVVRDALVAELDGFEARKELWVLQCKVLQRSPHLIHRGLKAHVAEERALAVAITDWLGSTRPGTDAPPGASVFPRLLAAVAQTALRVAVEHWCDRPGETALAEVFRDVFAQLAQGLPRPPA
ncbi:MULTISPECIES: TetR family transcriptional regulator [unclassified Streptomyces]|uniref:TetR family transcriptional regulator n=1 Tax=unclassified Streptomyces TaxID=2593676 RepID=UPI0005B36EEA|nr:MULTISPECIES: TetR family transcriptional regulator [unclassified Streptomyces]KPC82373.1 TetR family transcriptional regulator [Streptomyces sp. NRRL S-4]